MRCYLPDCHAQHLSKDNKPERGLQLSVVSGTWLLLLAICRGSLCSLSLVLNISMDCLSPKQRRSQRQLSCILCNLAASSQAACRLCICTVALCSHTSFPSRYENTFQVAFCIQSNLTKGLSFCFHQSLPPMLAGHSLQSASSSFSVAQGITKP